jgi:hypothetical protein
VTDVSFISLRLILPPIRDVLAPGGLAVALIKPQFEVGKGKAPGGLVRDEALRLEARDGIVKFATEELALELLNKLEDEDALAAIVVSALQCAGPVPADPFERRWRDEVGKACQVLAAHSAEVYRVLCGIPQRLK